MGNREDLIAGAKRCLLEKGYAATTARDIAAASGVSLAAIGYHFGSKDALMNQAVFDSVGDWADELQRAITADATVADGPASSASRWPPGSRWNPLADPAAGCGRRSWNSLGLAQRNDDLRAFLAGVQGFAGQGLARLFLGIDPDTEPEASRLAGPVMHALFIGLLAKYFLDPQQAPAAGDFAAGLRIIAGRMLAPGTGPGA